MKLFFLIIFLHNLIFALEINPELILQAIKTEKKDAESRINGTIYVNILNEDKVTSDFHYKIGDSGNRINVAQVKLLFPKIDLILGRQLMSWGSGYNFNPTDIFNKKPIGSSFDPSYSKNGRDALTSSIYFTDNLILDFIYAFKYEEENEYGATTFNESGRDDFGLRLKFSIFDFDFALSEVKVGKREYLNSQISDSDDHVTGISFKGSLPVIDWGVWFEGVRYNEQKVYEFSSGLEIIHGDYTAILEYYYNGFGIKEKSNYNLNNLYKSRLLGKNYLAPSISYVWEEKLTLSSYLFFNIDDSSFLIGSLLDYSYNDYINLSLIPIIISGSKDSEYGMSKDDYGSYGVQGLVKVNF